MRAYDSCDLIAHVYKRVVMKGLTAGRAVQVDSMKPELKPPGTKRLKLKCVLLLSTYALNFNLRRYTL
jgi:hypothetical protein